MSEEEAPLTVVERCPRCGADLPPGGVSECPYCKAKLARPWVPGPAASGYPLSPALLQGVYGYEYKSQATLFGLPLVHIAQGIDPQTGRPRVARGIIAVGNVAFGVVALGGVAFGGLAIGGMAVGVLALGGMAAGFAALGGMSFALWLALGGMAISLQYAFGGLAVAPHALGGNVQNPELMRWLERWLGLSE
jgi:hypothetical protein